MLGTEQIQVKSAWWGGRERGREGEKEKERDVKQRD